jgi:hypothetical protein
MINDQTHQYYAIESEVTHTHIAKLNKQKQQAIATLQIRKLFKRNAMMLGLVATAAAIVQC